MAVKQNANKVVLQRGALSRWFSHHAQAFLSSFREMLREPVSTLLVILVLMVVLAWPLAFYQLSQWIESSPLVLSKAPTVSLYLQPQLQESKVNRLLTDLEHDQRVEKVEYISPEKGLLLFQQSIEMSGLDLTQQFSSQHNPLPGVVVLTPLKTLHDKDLENLTNRFKLKPEVMTVQWDQVWLDRLNNFLNFLDRFIVVLMILLTVLVILVVQNVVKAILSKHRKQLMLLRLLGAESAYIRRPILYRGFFYGVLASLGAVVINFFLFSYLGQPLSALLASYEPGFLPPGLGASSVIFIFLVTLLSIFASWLAFIPTMFVKET